MKGLFLGLGLIMLAFVGGFLAFSNQMANQNNRSGLDPKNAIFAIDGKMIKLHNGISEAPATSESVAKTVTKYFGNEAEGDINEDGASDHVFLVTQEAGGSGTFFYAIAVLNTSKGYVGTEGFLLGDRIAPQTTEIKNGIIVVNYVERAPGEQMTTRPSIGVTKRLVIMRGKLVEWKLSVDVLGRAKFNYPESIGTKYVSPVGWPPKLEALVASFKCAPSGSTVTGGGETKQKTIGGHEFCVTMASEGATGSVYDSYQYVFVKDGQVARLSFVLKLVQCANYDEPEKTECANERIQFNADNLINRIVESVEIK